MNLLYILIVAVVVWFVVRQLTLLTPQKRIEKNEEFAELMLSSYRTSNKVSYGKENDDPEVIRMRNWYIRLKEKYKYDKTKLMNIAEDWKDYTYCLSSKNINAFLSIESEDSESERQHTDKARESYLRIEEIENRFAMNLGGQSREELEIDRKKKQEEREAFWNSDI